MGAAPEFLVETFEDIHVEHFPLEIGAKQRFAQTIHKLAHREAKAKSVMTLASLLDPSRGGT